MSYMFTQRSFSPPRRALRRAVELPCEVVSRFIDRPLLYWASDLTGYGVWLETPAPMEVGEQVVVCFRPAVWWGQRELMVFSEVTRVMWARRAEERGMGLEFLDLTVHERRALDGWLHGRPPPLPRRRRVSGTADGSRALPPPRMHAALAN